jgi:hypothetical protein
MRTPLSFLAASLLAFLVCSLTNGINRAKAFAAGANGQSEANVSGKLSGKPESAHTAVPADQPLYDAEADDENPIDAALRKQKAAPDLRRYTIANITAPIPPDKDHDQALQLEYFVPAITRGDSPRGATFFVSVHGADKSPSRLSVRKTTGDAHFLQLLTATSDDESSQFDLPQVFATHALMTGADHEYSEWQTILDLPIHNYWVDGDGVVDTLFVVSGDDLQRVAIPDVDGWYEKQLKPGEWTWHSFSNEFSQDRLELSFHIWEKGQCHACTGGADVTGSYRLVGDENYNSRPGPNVRTWKLIVANIQRGPTTPPPQARRNRHVIKPGAEHSRAPTSRCLQSMHPA